MIGPQSGTRQPVREEDTCPLCWTDVHLICSSSVDSSLQPDVPSTAVQWCSGEGAALTGWNVFDRFGFVDATIKGHHNTI